MIRVCQKPPESGEAQIEIFKPHGSSIGPYHKNVDHLREEIKVMMALEKSNIFSCWSLRID
jgi:hypothetical protein